MIGKEAEVAKKATTKEAFVPKVVIDSGVTLKQELVATTHLTQNFDLSDEQTAIARAVLNGSGNILVIARAGTGKTFLLRKCVPLMKGEIAVCAYNTKIAKEIRGKLGDDGYLRSHRLRIIHQAGADVGTFHAFGWAIVRKLLRPQNDNDKNPVGVRLEGFEEGQAGFKKFPKIAEKLNIPQQLYSVVRNAMERAQERGFGVLFPDTDRNQWLALADHFSLESDLPDDGKLLAQMLVTSVKIDESNWRSELLKICLQYARKAIVVSLDMVRETFVHETTVGRGDKRRVIQGTKFKGVISFTEMLYLPLVWNMDQSDAWDTYNWVLVDEAQDSNPLRREMARRMLKPGGRMIWLGW